MLTEATKKYRDVLAFGLVGVAALVLLSGISLLFKQEEDMGGAGFAERALLFGPVFTSVVIIGSLVLAVVIACAGEASKQAKPVVLAALGVGGVAALFAVIAWLSSYGVDDTGGFGFGGVPFAGKVVGTLLNLASIGLIALALLFFVAVLQRFPKAAPAHQQWGQPGQQQWGQPGQQWGQPGQPQWGQPGQQQWGQPGQQQWGQPGFGAAGWGDQSQAQAQRQGQPAASWDQQTWGESGQQGWAVQQPGHQQGSGGQAWGSQQAQGSGGWDESPQQGWGGEHAQQSWSEPGQQAWGERSQQQGWGEQPSQQGWGEQPSQQEGWSETGQPSWGETQRPSSSETGQQGSADAAQETWGSAAEQPPGGWPAQTTTPPETAEETPSPWGAGGAHAGASGDETDRTADRAVEETQAWEGGEVGSAEPEDAQQDDSQPEDQQGQRGWWQQ